MRIVPEKSYQENFKRSREEVEKKTGKTLEELYEEREERVRDPIKLKEPDRVSVKSYRGNYRMHE